MKTPAVIAHRGASAVTPENTRAAVAEAIRRGADLVEVDVRETADGELVLFHDDDLKRVAGRKGRIETSDWATVAELDVGAWFGDGYAGERPLRLGEAIRLCREGGVGILIEHKSGDPATYVRALEAADTDGGAIALSSDPAFLVAVREGAPGVALGALGRGRLTDDRLARIGALAPEWVAWKAADLRPARFALLHERGIRVALWTVNDRAAATPWIERGIDALITDRPAEMRAWVEGE